MLPVTNGISGGPGGNETLTLNGGTLDLTGHAIGDATNTVSTLNFQSGTLKNVTSINGTAGLTKTTACTLTLDGTMGYTGVTTISAGTLRVGAATHTGNTTVSFGTLEIATTGSLRLAPTANGISNKITGTGALSLKGIFNTDLTSTPSAGFERITVTIPKASNGRIVARLKVFIP